MITLPLARASTLLALLAQAPAPPAAAPGQSAAAPASPDAVVSAEAPIVAHNVASAKQRALEEAFFQAVDRAFVRVLAVAGADASAPPPALAQLRAGFRTRARRYVRSYRVLSEGEAGAVYRVELEADVDDVFLRREIERARTGPAAPGVGPAIALLVAGTGPAEAGKAIAGALGTGGAKTQLRSDVADVAAAREAAVRAALPFVALYSASAVPEGPVRGTGAAATSCRISLQIVPAAGTGGAVAERAASARGFDEAGDASAAQADCWRRASAQVVADARPSLAATGGQGARVVTVVVELEEPSLVDAIRRALGRVGAVSSHELRRISVGRIELRVVTRLGPDALFAALARELGSVADLTPTGDGRPTSDALTFRARSRTVGVLPAATEGAPR
jgi:hypothetical protein